LGSTVPSGRSGEELMLDVSGCGIWVL